MVLEGIQGNEGLTNLTSFVLTGARKSVDEQNPAIPSAHYWKPGVQVALEDEVLAPRVWIERPKSALGFHAGGGLLLLTGEMALWMS